MSASSIGYGPHPLEALACARSSPSNLILYANPPISKPTQPVVQPSDGKTDSMDAQSPPDQLCEDISMQALQMSQEYKTVAALHATPLSNPASCKTRGTSVYTEAATLDLINASEDGGGRLKPLYIPSLLSQSPGVASLRAALPLNPASCKTLGTSVYD